jgi:pyruvate dehydrogenase kinase 2/3/4
MIKRPLGTPNFYDSQIIQQYAIKETKRVTLRQLTVFGRSLTKEKLLKSANYVREELPIRLAHRIRDFQV